jgi:hypothetical protein
MTALRAASRFPDDPANPANPEVPGRERVLRRGARGCPLKKTGFSTDLEHRAAAADEDASLRELGPADALEFVEVFPGRRPAEV